MPPRDSVAQDRDADYTQKIIEYDEKVISPAFEKYIQSQPMNRRIVGTIGINKDGRPKDAFHTGDYVLGEETVEALGSNIQSIMQLLEKLYRDAGYQTQLVDSGKGLVFSNDKK